VNPSEGVGCSGYSYQQIVVNGVQVAYVKGEANYGSMGEATVPVAKGSTFIDNAVYGCAPQTVLWIPLQ
jgi:hypothetical protein